MEWLAGCNNDATIRAAWDAEADAGSGVDRGSNADMDAAAPGDIAGDPEAAWDVNTEGGIDRASDDATVDADGDPGAGSMAEANRDSGDDAGIDSNGIADADGVFNGNSETAAMQAFGQRLILGGQLRTF